MKKQINHSSSTGKISPIGIFLMLELLLGLSSSATATDSLLYKGSLVIPGTNQKTDQLTVDQPCTLLQNDQYTLKWQSDGNLALYFYDEELVWASNTDQKGSVLSFASIDGKLIIRDTIGRLLWSTSGENGNLLKLQWDRNLLLLGSGGQKVWESGTALPSLGSDGSLHKIGYSDKKAQDFIIPLKPGFKYLYLLAEGADGGKRHIKDGAITRFQVAGGSGATIKATFEIGTAINMIPPGSIVRAIVGKAGGTRTVQTTAACEGGAGTGVLFKKPNDSNWHILLVAGGGGGAYSDCCTDKHEGREGQTGENGGNGGGSGYVGGGSNGHGGVGGFVAGHGYHNGWAGTAYWDADHSEAPPANSLPKGSEPPQVVNWTLSPGGTYGFGGGGKYSVYGGGGGGYSGGGSGASYHAGGGGGSYVNPDLAKSEIRRANGTTTDTQDGFVAYQFANTPDLYNTIRLASNTARCIDDAGSQTAVGTNIQLWDCNASEAQSWYIDGLAIKLKKDLSKCIDLDYSKTDNGTNIQLWACSGTHGQRWIYDGITKTIRSVVDQHKCIDLTKSNTANGTNIQLFDCNGTGAQHWNIDWATNPTISTNYNRIHLAIDPGKCIDVYAGKTGNGNNIQIYHCLQGGSQDWYFYGHTIRLNKDRNKCMDLSQSDTANGANIQLWDCNGTNAQNWTYDGMTRSFRSWVDPTKCIDLSMGDTTDKSNIQLWDCQEGNTNQQFLIGE